MKGKKKKKKEDHTGFDYSLTKGLLNMCVLIKMPL